MELASLYGPILVPQLIAQTIGLRPAVDQPVLDSLLSFLHPKQLLLVLDNCEHLIEACAQLTRQLLSQAPALRILATSREPLSVAGENIYPVPGLAWPNLDGKGEAPSGAPDPHSLLDYICDVRTEALNMRYCCCLGYSIRLQAWQAGYRVESLSD